MGRKTPDARSEEIFWEVRKDGEGRYQTIRESFFLFYQKIKDGKAGWQVVGDALTCEFSITLYI